MSMQKGAIACCLATAAFAVTWIFGGSFDNELDGDKPSTSVVSKAHNTDTKKDLSVLPSLPDLGNDFAPADGIKDVFDLLILEAGEQVRETWQLVSQKYCETETLTAQACEQFKALFGRYIDYKYALSSVEAQTVNYASALQEIEYRLSQINDLQHQFFSAQEIQILFGSDNDIEASALVRHRIAKDPTLNREQKLAMLRHHFDSMPETEKQAYMPSLKLQSIQDIKQLPYANDYKLALVSAQFGHEAADRLAKTWEVQHRFAQRVQGLKDDYKQVATKDQQTWLEQHFSKNQAKRARVLLAQLQGVD